MNVIGIGNYGLINSNYAKKTSTDEVQVSTSFADIVQNKFNTAEGTMSVGIGRLPAKSAAEASHMVDKISRYINRLCRQKL